MSVAVGIPAVRDAPAPRNHLSCGAFWTKCLIKLSSMVFLDVPFIRPPFDEVLCQTKGKLVPKQLKSEAKSGGRCSILSLIFPFRNLIHPRLSIFLEPVPIKIMSILRVACPPL